MTRRRHSKSQSISSDVNSTKSPNSPPPKFATPVQRTPRRPTLSSPTSPTASVTPTPERTSKIPTVLQFPLVVVLSFVLSSLLFSLNAEFVAGDLAAISKHTESWAEIVGLLCWKVVELAIFWFGRFDAYDVASLSILISTPHALLLYFFFSIRPLTLVLSALANLVSTTLPFYLLRPLLPSHKPSTALKGTVRNRPILTDPYTTIFTSLLATAILAVLIELSFATFLPVYLITHFANIRDLTAAHLGASGLPALLVMLIPAGYAAMEFLFVPSTGEIASEEPTFDPQTASLSEHVYWNAWGWYSARQKMLIKRTVLAGGMVVSETMVHAWGTVEGVELVGALGYAGIWGVGIALVGAVFDWVGGPSG